MDITLLNLHNYINILTNIQNDTIDLSKFSFIEPVAIAIIKSLEISKLKNKHLSVIVSNNVGSYIDTILNSSYEESKTYIPIETVNSINVEEAKNKIVNKISHYTLNLFKEEDDQEDFKRFIDHIIGEILNNAIYHSLSTSDIVINAQYFSYQFKLQVNIVDTGVGFYHNISKISNEIHNESEAIKLALEKGISSPPDCINPYYSEMSHAGYGLYFLKTLIEKSKGNLFILSNNGLYLMENGQEIKKEEINSSWQGSIVSFEIFPNKMKDLLDFGYEYFLKLYIWDTENFEDEDMLF